MNNEHEAAEGLETPENMPEAPPGWQWRIERTPTGVRRLILVQTPSEAENEASQQDSK